MGKKSKDKCKREARKSKGFFKEIPDHKITTLCDAFACVVNADIVSPADPEDSSHQHYESLKTRAYYIREAIDCCRKIKEKHGFDLTGILARAAQIDVKRIKRFNALDIGSKDCEYIQDGIKALLHLDHIHSLFEAFNQGRGLSYKHVQSRRFVEAQELQGSQHRGVGRRLH